MSSGRGREPDRWWFGIGCEMARADAGALDDPVVRGLDAVTGQRSARSWLVIACGRWLPVPVMRE